MRFAVALLSLSLLAPLAAAHGDLAINELETLAIRDFEGMEDSFPWDGFEIWDVYVGEGYNETLDSDGVYIKANFAGDGTKRTREGQSWTLDVSFLIGEVEYERRIVHDGVSATSDFESFAWSVSDGNVLQVKGWVAVPDWKGQVLTDLVIVSSVDEEPRDTAPGGVHAPGSGSEAPVQGPGTPVFPPIGEGRIVDEVPLTGPGKFLNVTLVSNGTGAYDIIVANPLKEQGQHVFVRPETRSGWSVGSDTWMAEIKGGSSATFPLRLESTPGAGADPTPFAIDLVSDIGGRSTLYAVIDGSNVVLVTDIGLADAVTIPAVAVETPGPFMGAVIGVLALVALTRRRIG